MWSESIIKLGRNLDVLNAELSKQYTHKGGNMKPMVLKICDVFDAIWELAEICHISDAIKAELYDRGQKKENKLNETR